MNSPSDFNWMPDTHLLAAYFDGELDGRGDSADLRARIEAWLETHAEAAEEWHKQRRLQKLWLDTTPAEPTAAQWNHVLDKIDAKRRARPAPTLSRARHAGMVASVLAASIALVVALVVANWNRPSPPTPIGPVGIRPIEKPNPIDPPNLEVFSVVSASEVTIFCIEGADTGALVVGELPLSGLIELVNTGDVRIVSRCPKTNIRQDGPERPMVWARLE